ncbi:MAG: class I SAM-dependent methyltransferase [Bacteroidetes bacterium]|nr:class I SAM-dependent methyltransferase [Bacteroidota bacterium]
MTISDILHHQQAPPLLLRFPRLLFLYFRLNRISVLRMKYAYRAVRRILKDRPAPRTVIDAGCGMGDYLFMVPEFASSGSLIGIDVSQSNIELCNALAKETGRQNMSFVCSDLVSAELPADVDLILCIGVLMYIGDDRAVLKNFHRSLAPGGRLALYTAVNYRRTLPLYKRLARIPGFDYDQVIGRPQTYSDAQLEERLAEAGFTIIERRPSFGSFAAVMFEISAIFEWFFKSLHPILWLLLIPFYIIFYPLYLISMTADVLGKRSTGNGVMIIAEKRAP